ncbi:MAG TPA: cytochrome c3 family protein [Pirellulales bacterium]|jgi:predicted CXXCH cytochrome family protein|nr:cytochrome c3 family protein [Pirellulales bacterium]
MAQTWYAARRGGLILLGVAALVTVAAVARHLLTPSLEVLAPRGAEIADYVGSARCAECHREMTEHQSRSRMAATLQTAEEFESGHSLPVPAELLDPDNHLRYRIDRRDGKLFLEVWRGREVARAEMTYALGSGKVAVTFVRDLDADNYQELRASWYADTNAWDLTPGQRGARPVSVTEALGRPIGKRSPQACLTCHASLLVQSDAEIDPARSRFGVGCERCHGPGRAHIESVATGRATVAVTKIRPPALDEALALAQRLREGRRAETPQDELLRSVAQVNDERLVYDLYVCGECHGYDQIWNKPSDDNLVKFQVAALVGSRCYERSQRKIRCTDCHDPHGDSSPDDVGAAVAVCLKCHQDPATSVADGVPSPPLATDDTPQQLKVCPVNARDGCVGCHMPIRSPMLHARMTHHRIAIYGHREAK